MVSEDQLKEWGNYGGGLVAFWLLVGSVFYALLGDVMVAGLMRYPYAVGFASGVIALFIVESAVYFIVKSPISNISSTNASQSVKSVIFWAILLIISLVLAVLMLIMVFEGLQVILGWAGVDPANQFELSKEIIQVILTFVAIPALLYYSYRQLKTELAD